MGPSLQMWAISGPPNCACMSGVRCFPLSQPSQKGQAGVRREGTLHVASLATLLLQLPVGLL